MRKMRINFKLIIVLLISVATLAVTATGLRKWNRNHRASLGFEEGTKAFENQQWEDAAEHFGNYITIVPNDVDVLIKYGKAQMNRIPMTMSTINQAVNAYRRILRIDRSNKEAVGNLMDIYIYLLDSPAEAELIASQYLKFQNDYKIRQMLAMSLFKQRKFESAKNHITQIISEEPADVESYAILARFAQDRPEDFNDLPGGLYDEAVSQNNSCAMAYIYRGEYQLSINKLQEAAEDFLRAEQCSLDDVSSRLRLADGFLNVRDFKKARQHLEYVSKVEPDNAVLWQIWARLALQERSNEEMQEVARMGCESLKGSLRLFLPAAAELYITCGDYEQAAEIIEKLKKEDDTMAVVAYMEGLMARKQGNAAKAIKLWRKARQEGLDSEQINISIASALVETGDIQSALIQLRNYVNKNKDNYGASLMLAELLVQSGRISEASDQINSYLQTNPFDTRAQMITTRIMMIKSLQQAGDQAQTAWENIEKQLEANKEIGVQPIPMSLMVVGAALQGGKVEYARNIIEKLKQDNAMNLDVLLAEIDVIIAEEKIDLAETRFQHIAGIFPDSIKAIKYRASFYAYKGDMQMCEKILVDSLDVLCKPDHIRDIKLLLAEVYEDQGLFEKGCSQLLEMHEDMPSDIPITRRLISMCRKAGRESEIQTLVDDVKSAEGSDGWQWRYEQARHWFDHQEYDKKYSQIVHLLKENLKTNPDDQNSRLLLSAVYEKAEEYQLASSVYRQALERSPDNIEIIVSAIAAMYKAGQYDLANEIMQRNRDTGNTDPRLSRLELSSYLRKGDISSACKTAEILMAQQPDNKDIKLSVALLNIREAKYEKARKILEQLSADEPNSLTVSAAVVELNMEQGRKQQALAICSRLVNNLSNVPAYLLRGRTHLRCGNMDLAKNDLQQVLTIDPVNVTSMVLLARLYQAQRQSDKAVEIISKALEIAPDSSEVQKQAALIFVASEEPRFSQRTVSAIDNAIVSNPQDVELLITKARLLISQRTSPAYDQADEILERARQLDPENPGPWAISAEIAYIRGRVSKAMDYVLRGLAFADDNKLLLLSKARIEASVTPDESIRTLEMLHGRHPEDADIAVYLSYMHLSVGQAGIAVDLLEQFPRSTDSQADLKIETALVEALYENGDKEKALQKIGNLYQQYPDNPVPLLTLVRIYSSHNQWQDLTREIADWYRSHPEDSSILIKIAQEIVDYQKPQAVECAEDILHQIIETDYSNVEALNTLGVIYHITGRFPQALNYYEKVLMIAPDRIMALNNMAWILCEDLGKYQQAVQLAERGLNQQPDYADLVDTCGVAMYRLGRYAESIHYFERCIELYVSNSPGLAGAHFHLARSLEKMDLTAKAVKHLKKAIEMNKAYGGLTAADLNEANLLLSRISEGY